MKKLISLLLTCISAVLFAISTSAEQDVNLMADYRNLTWEGDKLYYNENYGTLSFNDGTGKASVTFPTENSLGFWFYADMGNYQNKGTGYMDVIFLDSDDNIIKSFVTEKNSGNGSFNRYQLGKSDEFVQVPDKAEKVQITLFYSYGDKSPYFRNLSLVLSDSRAVNTDISDWTVSGKLEIVQVGVTRTDHIIWIVIVVLVPLIMFATRKLMDRAKKIK